MEAVTPLVNAALLAVFTLVITWIVRGQVAALGGQMVALRQDVADLRTDMRELRAEMRDMRSELAAVRSDLTHVALAIGARPRPQTG
jgi:citrate lyase beta subunit